MTLKKCFASVLFGLALAGLGVYLFLTEDDGWWEKLKCLGIILAGVGYAFMMWYDYRRDKPEQPESLRPEERCQGVDLAAELPRSLLAERFLELAPKEEELNAEDPDSFLGWKTSGDGDFHLFPDGSDEGQGWVALWWGRSIHYVREASGGVALRAAKPLDYLRDSEVEALCQQHGAPVQDGFFNMQPNGLAFYRAGKLTIYPAAYEAAFRQAFLSTILAPPKEFHEWAEWYYAEEEDESEV